jgi:transcriptional regulator with XRE-family HTH domain
VAERPQPSDEASPGDADVPSDAVSSDGGDDLGARLRARRLELGLTLLDVARAAGLTKSFLSQVERGRNSPSIATLRSIAQALAVPMFYFFQGETTEEIVVRRDERRILSSPRSGFDYELLTPDVRRSLEMLIINIEPGRSTGTTGRPHEGEECALVLYGRVRAEVGGAVHDLSEGDSIYVDATQPHRYHNSGPVKATLITAMTPPSF